MAFIYRNALTPAIIQWNGFMSTYNRFKRAWSTTTEDNIAVYNKKLYYYRSKSFIEDTALKRFLKALGVEWESFKNQNIDGEIDDIWFYLNNKYEWDGSTVGDTYYDTTAVSTQLVTPTAAEIVTLFDDAFTIGDKFTVTVEYGGSTGRYIDTHEQTWDVNDIGVIESTTLNSTEIREQLNSDPWYYFANSRHLDPILDSNQFQLYDGSVIDYTTAHNEHNRASNRLLGTTIVSTRKTESTQNPNEALGIFALMHASSGSTFTTNGEILDEKYSTSSSPDGEVLAYTYSQEFTYNGITEDNSLITDILLWFTNQPTLTIKHRPRFRPVGEYRDDLTYSTKDTSFKKVLDSMVMYEDPITHLVTRDVTNSLFYDGKLRVIEAGQMRKRHFTEMIATSLETDYKVEDAEWWEIVLTVIIIIVAVVVGVMTGGASFAASGTIFSAIATGAGYASLILAIGMTALSMVGGLSAQGLVKVIGAFAQIVGWIATITGLMAAVQAAGRVAAEQAAKEAGADLATKAGQEAVKNIMLEQTFLDQVGAYLNQSLTSVTTKLTEFVSMDLSSQISFISDSISTITKGLDFYADKENEALEKELETLKEEEKANDLENLSNQLKHPAEIYMLMSEEIHSPDMLANLDKDVQSKIGQDKNFAMWNSNVNST